MKKFLLPLLAVAAFNFGTAQEESIRFGAKAGLNLSNIVGDFDDNNDTKIGLNIGAVVEIPVTEKFAIQPELLFSTQGAKAEFDDVELSSTGEIINIKEEAEANLNYVNIPIMAKYYIAQGFSLQAGPQIGILISAEDKDGEDFKDTTSAIDFGLNFGAGYQLASGIFFDARYNLGLSNINDLEGDEDFSQKNSVISISLGYKF